MKKRMIIMTIALTIVFGGIIGFNIFKGYMIKRFFASYEPPAVNIASVKAIQKKWSPRINAVANFVAQNGIEINPETTGVVQQIHFNSGQFVEKGTPLIDIDDQTELATLKFNKAELALRELNYKRQQDLFKRGATSSAAVDEANASLKQAQANVERTQAEINRKHLSAPFTGQLGIRQISLGQYLTPGQTPIVTLQSLDPLYLEFYLPEHLIKRLAINQTIEFNMDEFPNLLFQGKISAINAKADTRTHNVLVQATVANCPLEAVKEAGSSVLVQKRKQAEGEKTVMNCSTALNRANQVIQYAFIPGMFASLSVKQPAESEVVVLPSTAISYSLYGNSVFVIEKDNQKDKDGTPILRAKRVFVSTGDQEGNFTVIKKGIKKDQEVVSSGELKLENGTRVVINNSVKLNVNSNPEKLSQ